MGVFAGIEPTWAAQTDVGRTHIATKGIVQSGLVLNLDAGVSSSYPGSGTTWTDLSGNGNDGYTDDFVNFCRKIREDFGQKPIIMAGNVSTPEMVQEIILHGGVDIVKVGIGPGSACTTRLKTGVGYPQLSAIIECSHAAHGLRAGQSRIGLICADGGCRTSSDVCKAFAAGADFVMLGGMLAGTDQCEGDWEYDNGNKKALKFYGMSSHAAQKKYGGVKNYRASEGRIKKVTYKGDASLIVEDILGGLRSACSYIGSTSLKHMSRCAEFNLVNRTHFDQSV